MAEHAETTVGLSFDDNLLSQFKWSRAAWRWGVRAVLYVNPATIGVPGWLEERMLRQAVEEWGHVAGNHTWNHESPKKTAVGEVVESAERTREWLDAKGWTEGSSWLALPWGVRGGRWTEESLEALRTAGFKLLRDVRFLGEAPESGAMPQALEWWEEGLVEGKCNLYYFHHDGNTLDSEYEMLLNRIEDVVKSGRARNTLPPEWR